MDSRFYFVLGDLFSNIAVGLVAGVLAALVVGEDWNMFLAMILAMVLGMVVGTVLWLPLGVLFGAMEVMLSTMFGGMMSGMVVGMWVAMSPVSVKAGALVGMACGLLAIVIIWIMNSRLRGIRDLRKER
ncbi:hypothetical protein [Candidatus Marimicrobium litorale]|uniref:Uncharacterized protein n=1 Tax=Candidatus Marimicrobium litorale TaxID=2518991 RepID=A0ABT3T4M5_9GAMM|nr:hypothetical protein [Candidatus Marimicrobium litorale]MCX2977211.1 hypothetical protein [Candidatus Marimicrobium litorale]